ncbi:MAG: HAMP domain-containing histidine kinase [Lachnospiraceae bacterium]|nr:HAMP domain-containing histidine kinase [Lachnospiraceae bacterium]
MKFSLRVKLTIAYFLILCMAFALLATVGTSMAVKEAENDVRDSLYRDATYASALYRENVGTVNREFLTTIARISGAEVWVMDSHGTVMATSDPDQASFPVPDFRASDGIGGYYMIGDFYGTHDNEVLTVYTSLTKDVTVNGYIFFHYPTALTQKNADRTMFYAYLTFWLFTGLITLLILWISLSVITPLRKVVTAGHEYVNGNLTYPNPVHRSDEVGSVALAEEELAKQLQSSADDQHRFLQNISHDFRSPLTSIRGYMVAIQDGTIPPEMQGKYLDIAISETDRLTNLANGLLDITQLENGAILKCGTFDINGLIREILPTFEGRVREKNLVFNVTFEAEQQNVYADRQRIAQVIHNLVDNAIKFSGQNSSIDLSTSLSGGKVFTSVKDHGVGIEKENIDKIWTRFYKTDASRGKDKKGSGLGLSIVRDIIQNHKEHIDVISTPGVGTEFVFTLPAAE